MMKVATEAWDGVQATPRAARVRRAARQNPAVMAAMMAVILYQFVLFLAVEGGSPYSLKPWQPLTTC